MRLPTARATASACAAATVLLLTAACGSDNADAGAADSSSSDSSQSDAPESDAGDADTYADGTYEATGSYANPGGTSSVDVTLTLADNTVTDVEVAPGATGTSLTYQEKFISGIDDEVVGKAVNDIAVSKVSGSSLTSQGFSEALAQIKSEAAA
jgi:hypothetical protein